MGKKNRKKASKAAAAAGHNTTALPSIDLDAIDSTKCALCHAPINIEFWTDHDFSFMRCCGHFLCRSCNFSQDNDRKESLAELDNLVDHVKRSCRLADPVSLLPRLIAIESDANPPCIICATPIAKSQKEINARLERLAQAGHSYAQCHLGQCYKAGVDVKKDPIMAIKWLKKAAAGGCARAAAVLGDMYFTGKQIPRSLTQAKWWYEQAPNDATAQCGLAHILHSGGEEVPPDQVSAIELFRQSAEQECPGSLNAYGAALARQGRLAEALVQYEKCASLEKYLYVYPEAIAGAQTETARLLLSTSGQEARQGIISDPAKDPFPAALFWARRAVRNGHHDEKLIGYLEQAAHARCRNCGRSCSQSQCVKCPKCRAASFCDRTCQVAAWKAGHRDVCNELPRVVLKDECSQCGKANPAFMCRGCAQANYCNVECQTRHWETQHKNECKLL